MGISNPFKIREGNFVADCKQEGETLLCTPREKAGNIMLKGERPMKIKIVKGEQAVLEDDGATPEALVEKTLKYVERYRLDK